MRKIVLIVGLACMAALTLPGFLHSQEIELAIVSESLSYLGSPYAYGGSEEAGFDCSGFVFLIYSKYVPNMPRRSIDQFRFGEIVDWGGLEPADLVFFKTFEAPVSHVGIYLGDDSFIHAASEGPRTGIIISSLKEPYYKASYMGARRVLSSSQGMNGRVPDEDEKLSVPMKK